ncbi:MAG: arylesterase [Thiomicrorhabdus chilensis]|uniref:arylesterase n=1 Tax=Thiomicrorhabdus chilensis TaxID=63656 RepID=UPI00299E9264|nr:arylesterase [Thiomicrorhabdus chilensis]MDX1348275.1 arylesterase [Thiomicrorhabdus chilensis]
MKQRLNRVGLPVHMSLLATLLLVLSGCSDHKLPPLAENAQILAFGDSLTLGVGVPSAQSYPAILARLSGREVINAGVSGETTAQGLERLPELLERHQPALLILLQGGNDVLRNVPAETVEANLGRMIEMAQQKGVAVLLVGVPEKGVFADTADWYENLSDDYGVPLEEEIIADLMGRLSMKSDYVHFNEKGYQALAEAIYQKLQGSGAL